MTNRLLNQGNYDVLQLPEFQRAIHQASVADFRNFTGNTFNIMQLTGGYDSLTLKKAFRASGSRHQILNPGDELSPVTQDYASQEWRAGVIGTAFKAIDQVDRSLGSNMGPNVTVGRESNAMKTIMRAGSILFIDELNSKSTQINTVTGAGNNAIDLTTSLGNLIDLADLFNEDMLKNGNTTAANTGGITLYCRSKALSGFQKLATTVQSLYRDDVNRLETDIDSMRDFDTINRTADKYRKLAQAMVLGKFRIIGLENVSKLSAKAGTSGETLVEPDKIVALNDNLTLAPGTHEVYMAYSDTSDTSMQSFHVGFGNFQRRAEVIANTINDRLSMYAQDYVMTCHPERLRKATIKFAV